MQLILAFFTNINYNKYKHYKFIFSIKEENFNG